MAIVRHRRSTPSPWSVLQPGRDIDRFFDAFNGAFGAPSLSGWSPPVDVREDANEFVVTAELPGMTDQDVQVAIEDGVLSLSGEKREEREEGSPESGQHIVERRYGRFERNFSLPRGVDADKVAASFKDGVLSVRLPKTAAAKPRQVKITG